MCCALWFSLQHVELIRAHIYDSKLVATLIVIFSGMLVYAIAALLFGAVRPREVMRAMKRGT